MGRGIAVIPTAPERVRNRDSHYPYRHDSYFYYLTGFPEPEAAVVLIAGETPPQACSSAARRIRQGSLGRFSPRPEAARAAFGFDAALPIGQPRRQAPELLAGQPVLHYSMGHDANWDDRLVDRAQPVRADVRTGCMRRRKSATCASNSTRCAWSRTPTRSPTCAAPPTSRRRPSPRHARHPRPAASNTRSRRSCCTSSAAAARRPGLPPSSPAAPTPASCTTSATDQPLRDGELLLIDAGCELDLRRGHHPHLPGEREVLPGAARCLRTGARRAAPPRSPQIAPGQPWDAPHEAAVRVLAQGMLDLGCSRAASTASSSPAPIAASTCTAPATGWAWTCTTPANTSRRRVAPLVPGMTLTVEPGCYIRAAEGVPEATLEHRHPHRGQRPGHRRRLRDPHRSRAKIDRRDRSADARTRRRMSTLASRERSELE
jgi:Xaa-Pro aminopeptidase